MLRKEIEITDADSVELARMEIRLHWLGFVFQQATLILLLSVFFFFFFFKKKQHGCFLFHPFFTPEGDEEKQD